MYRFFSPHTQFESRFSITDSSEIHHIKNVLRLKKGSRVQFFNGQDTAGEGEIENISPRGCQIKVIKIFKKNTRSVYLTLACAPPKKSKFETIVEKATELGIDEIIPLKTKRTEMNLTEERAAKKQKRYQAVAINAAKQCRRMDIPKIQNITNFKICLDQLKADTFLVMPGLIKHRKKITDLLPLDDKITKIAVLIGPEGDFTPEEYTHAARQGAHIVSLGKQVLKVETAALVAASFIQLNIHT